MKSAAEMYPTAHNGGFFVGDYTPIIQELGEVLVREDDSDYQGDTFVLLRKSVYFGNYVHVYGYACIGWGSCSGCDALQGCNSYEEVDELARSIANGVRWGTAEEISAYLKGSEERVEYHNSMQLFHTFRNAALAKLSGSTELPSNS